MGLEYICKDKGHFFRINTDVPCDDRVCDFCNGALVKHEFGFKALQEVPVPNVKLKRGERNTVSGKIIEFRGGPSNKDMKEFKQMVKEAVPCSLSEIERLEQARQEFENKENS